MIRARPTLTQETGRAKQLIILMTYFHQGPQGPTSSKMSWMCWMPITATTRIFIFVLGVGERGHFFEESEIFAMKSAWNRHEIFVFEIKSEASQTFVLVFLMRMRCCSMKCEELISTCWQSSLSLYFLLVFGLKSAVVAVICESSNGHTYILPQGSSFTFPYKKLCIFIQN